jgi:chaperonin GroES
VPVFWYERTSPKRETKGGIALPDQAEIPTITGRIVTISAQIENDPDVPLRQYDKILFHPKNAIPVDFEPDNQLFVVPVEDVVAVFRREVGAPRVELGTSSLSATRSNQLSYAPLLRGDFTTDACYCKCFFAAVKR